MHLLRRADDDDQDPNPPGSDAGGRGPNNGGDNSGGERDHPDHYDIGFPAYKDKVSSGGGAGIAIAVLFVLLVLGFIGFHLYKRYRARRLGLPPPPINPFSDRNRIAGSKGGGIVGWVKDKFSSARRGRQAGGAYEGAGGGFGGAAGGSARRNQRGSGFRGLDPDEAWDERVGNEADFEEQELGLRNAPAHSRDDSTAYHGGGAFGTTEGRNELDDRYDTEMGRSRGRVEDPFADPTPGTALRGVSPKVSEDDRGRLSFETEQSKNERRSVFREGSMG